MVNAVDGSAAPSIRIQLGDWRSVTTDNEGLFEIELGSGVRVRVPGSFDADALSRLLGVLERA